MKKSIIAILLSLSVFCLSFSCGTRRASAAATGSIVAIASIGTLAFSVFSLITSGQAEKIADDVYNWIEYTAKPGMEVAFTGDGSWLATGYNQVFQSIKGWFDSGELEVVDGQVKLTYDQFHELYGQVLNASSNIDVGFHTDYNYLFLNADLSKTFSGSDLPLVKGLYNVDYGQAYAPVFYNENTIIFSDTFFLFTAKGASYYVGMSYINQYFFRDTYSDGFNNLFVGPYTDKPNEFLVDYQYIFYFPSLSDFSMSLFTDMLPSSGSQLKTFHFSSSHCFVYSDGDITYKPLSEVDTTGMQSGLVTTTGAFGDFLKSVNDYIPSLVPPEGLDDLSNVLPTEYNPSLSFPVNPDLTRPLPNQVIVGDVPGVADLPLSEYQAEIKTEIEVPSIICTKFPFCIPYDFIRFLGLLCSDPVAPVFRIPISTSPDNLEQWKGNQTVGEYLNADDPMFEIDEEIIIDLSVIPIVQPLCYTCFIVGFIFLLLHITPKMIQH